MRTSGSTTRLAARIAAGGILLALSIEGLAFGFGLPHLPSILGGVRELWKEDTLWHDVQVSTARCLIGWAVGATCGLGLGFVTGRIARAAMLLEGIFVLFRAIPFIVLLPLTMRVFGLSESGKIFLIGWAVAGICWIIVHQGSQNIPQHLLWRARSLGASRGKWLTQILLPACHDSVFAALRTSLSLALIVVAVAELGGVYERSSGLWWSEGLGYRLFRSLDQSRDDLLMAGILTFACLGIILDRLFRIAWTMGCAGIFRLRQRRVRQTLSQLCVDASRPAMKWTNPNPLDLGGISAGYGSTCVIADLRLHIGQGKTMSLVGPSGCGKTTLVRAIGHFVDDNFWIKGTSEEDIPKQAGPWVGIVMQDSPVFDFLTVWENITFGNRVQGLEELRNCWFMLEEFGLVGMETQRASTLSGGQRQRLALATALANRPEILLLDEPFGALDAITRRNLQHFYWQNVHGRTTALFVTHDVEEALLIGDFVRIGTASNAETFATNKEGSPPRQWEFGSAFAELRCKVIAALESTHNTVGHH